MANSYSIPSVNSTTPIRFILVFSSTAGVVARAWDEVGSFQNGSKGFNSNHNSSFCFLTKVAEFTIVWLQATDVYHRPNICRSFTHNLFSFTGHLRLWQSNPGFFLDFSACWKGTKGLLAHGSFSYLSSVVAAHTSMKFLLCLHLWS